MPQTTDWNLIRRILLGGYAVVFLISAKINGVPFDRLAVLSWMFAAFAVSSVGKNKAEVKLMMRDWFTLFAIYMLYDYSRGLADQLGMPVNYTLAQHVDKFLFFGNEPNAVLQHHFHTYGVVRWYDVVGSIVYMTHFFFPVIPLAWLRLRDRNTWLQYIRRFYGLLGSAVVIFVLFPAAPPWLAAQEGRLPNVLPTKLTYNGWLVLHVPMLTQTINRGQAVLNAVAAVPSLHVGCSVLVTLWFTRNRARWVRVVAMLYPIVMLTSLVYFGEHYVFDGICGAALTVIVWKLVARWEAKHPPHDPASHGTFDTAGDTEHELHVPHPHLHHHEDASAATTTANSETVSSQPE